MTASATTVAAAWQAGVTALRETRLALAAAPNGIRLQAAHDRALEAERRCTALVHGWLAGALELAPVGEPAAIFSVDVDGVLEDDAVGFSSTGLAGAAALRLLQLGRVAVLINTARGTSDVRERVAQFELLGGVGSCGASTWDAVYGQQASLVSPSVERQFARLRLEIRLDGELVIHSGQSDSVRVSRVVSGQPKGIPGPQARSLLERSGAAELSYIVAPSHTDFIDRNADKASGMAKLRTALGLQGLPMAAIGDAACDKQILHDAAVAFLPAATLPTFAAARGQRLIRSRYLGDQAFWDAACRLVPNTALQHDVAADVEGLAIPDWFPTELRRRLPRGGRFLPRFAATLTSVRLL